MDSLGIGIIGGGYMGKAHAVAMAAVGAVFNTRLRPRLEMVAASSDASAERYRAAFGFARATGDWRTLVADPAIDAVIIAAPQATHRAIAEAAAAAGKHILCEKPLAGTLADAEAMGAAAHAAGIVHMTGFNYSRTPATQQARRMIADGRLGDLTYLRIEHTEDFLADPDAPPDNWRINGRQNGTMYDLAAHPINAALALGGPIDALIADIATVHPTRPGPDGPVTVSNDDQAQFMCRFASGARGHVLASRTATGRKMGYAYDIYGTKGAVRFDQEDQNALWYYDMTDPPEICGFRKILTGPAHPDYLQFCQGPGHGTGYQDQIIIEARDFLEAIADGAARWPSFDDGIAVARITDAAFQSHESGAWVSV